MNENMNYEGYKKNDRNFCFLTRQIEELVDMNW